MMADPTVKARMKADADVLRADPRRTARFDGMLAETNSTLRGRFETARMSGSGNLGAAKAAVMGSGSVQTAGAVASAIGATAGAPWRGRPPPTRSSWPPPPRRSPRSTCRPPR